MNRPNSSNEGKKKMPGLNKWRRKWLRDAPATSTDVVSDKEAFDKGFEQIKWK
jgi:hypothetical protein